MTDLKTSNFRHYAWNTGLLDEQLDPAFPCQLQAYDLQSLNCRGPGTRFIFALDPTILAAKPGLFHLRPGIYASVPGECEILGRGRGIVVTRTDYDGFFQIGGPVEETGRLKYIDGCTDSLLIPPVKLGDPCLNLLCFPPGIDQTMHTHPSARAGLIYSGEGECITPEGVIPLTPGMIFNIPPEGKHKFRTRYQPMRVIAFHPNSDYGPTDECHPMKSMTFIDGVSASDESRKQYWTA